VGGLSFRALNLFIAYDRPVADATDQFDSTQKESASGGGGGSSSGRDWRHLSRLFEQLPPHAIEAEMSLLGSMMIDPQVSGDVVLVIRSGDDFYKPANGAIFDVMVELYDTVGALDIVQLNQVLADRGTLNSVGGLDYLIELADAVPSAANAVHYARLVRQKACIRQLIEAAGDILHDAYHSPEDAQMLLEQAEQKIFAIAQNAEQSHAESLSELIVEVYKQIEENDGELITGVPTSYTELDEMTHGLQKGEMVIIAARPSMGKTALALNIAENVALNNMAVGVFSLEMGKQQLVQRLLSSRSGVDSQKIRRAMLTRDDHANLQRACGELMNAPILIDDTPGLTLLQMRAKARRMASQHPLKAIVVDYLQLMSSGRRAESRQVEISEISRGIKAMARELSVPVIALSQLNRSPEQREGHKPRMSDLRESGSIEQDADVVMMLHREEYYHKGDPNWEMDHADQAGMAELIIVKQRNGPTGTVKLTWDGSTTRFKNYSPAMAPGDYYQPSTYEPPDSGGHFSAGRKTGPVEDHRDGGGPDADLSDIPDL
jgi:replicative DNA helicase